LLKEVAAAAVGSDNDDDDRKQRATVAYVRPISWASSSCIPSRVYTVRGLVHNAYVHVHRESYPSTVPYIEPYAYVYIA
jgi:hypothetical protein